MERTLLINNAIITCERYSGTEQQCMSELSELDI